MTGVVGFDTAEAQLQVNLGSTAFGGLTGWQVIPGVSGFTEDRAAAPDRDTITFAGTPKKAGKPRVQTVTADVAAWVPTAVTWKYLRQEFIAERNVSCRLVLQEELLRAESQATDTVAIATTGVVTFGAGANATELGSDQFAVGMSLQVDGTDYIVSEWPLLANGDLDRTKVKVFPAPTGAVAAKTYKIVMPRIVRGPFACKITSSDTTSLDIESDMATTLNLAPITHIPEYVINAPA